MNTLEIFKENWFCIVDLDSTSYEELEKIISNSLDKESTAFEQLHDEIQLEKLNDYRVNAINKINQDKKCRELVYASVKPYLEEIVGNELAIQRKVNLSIQLPEDDSSLLPFHSDVWAGNSAYEVVVWIPFMDVKDTQSMFILPKKRSLSLYEEIVRESKSIDSIYDREYKNLVWPSLKKGQALIFSHALAHGNTINKTDKSRVSLNLRFKSLMSPYSAKGLGEYFVPLKMKTATEIGLEISRFYE